MQPLLGEKAIQRGGATSHLPPEHVFDQRAERLPVTARRSNRPK
jgi:hypothetical protein